MRIYSLSKTLAFPLVVAIAGFLYMSFELDHDYAFLWAIVPLLLVVLLITMNGQIDYWWRSRNPLQLDPPIVDWLMMYDPYYQGLNDEDRQKYDNRMIMYMDGRAWAAVGSEHRGIPNDIQGIIASNGIKMMMGKDDFLIGDMDRIYTYLHPFPSPRYRFEHTVEVDAEDGVYIFSIEQLLPSMIDPKKYYNIGMHAYAEAYILTFTKSDYSYLDSISWDSLKEIGGYSKDDVLRTIGFNNVYISTVAINHFFTFPKRFKTELPEIYNKLCTEFNVV